jgi:hypothetical protein
VSSPLRDIPPILAGFAVFCSQIRSQNGKPRTRPKLVPNDGVDVVAARILAPPWQLAKLTGRNCEAAHLDDGPSAWTEPVFD